MVQYVITDRTTSKKWAISIDDGELSYDITTDSSSSEPIFRDGVNTGTYWKVFIEDGMLAWETIVIVQDDTVDLDDSTLDIVWRLAVANGEFYYFDASTITSLIFFEQFSIQPNISIDFNFEENVTMSFKDEENIRQQASFKENVKGQIKSEENIRQQIRMLKGF